MQVAAPYFMHPSQVASFQRLHGLLLVLRISQF